VHTLAVQLAEPRGAVFSHFWKRTRRTTSRLGASLACGWLTMACGQVELDPRDAAQAEPATERSVRLVVVRPPVQPTGPDAAPRVRLARRESDGSLVELPEEFLDALEFRRGAVVVTLQRALLLVHPDGSSSLLAREADGLPARASDGSIAYPARFGDVVEVHWLTVGGENQRLTSFHGIATRVAPKQDRTVVFIGAVPGGVVGVWVADASGARCVTNCGLRTGQPWGDAYVSPPPDTSRVDFDGQRVRWQASTGTWESHVLPARSE